MNIFEKYALIKREYEEIIESISSDIETENQFEILGKLMELKIVASASDLNILKKAWGIDNLSISQSDFEKFYTKTRNCLAEKLKLRGCILRASIVPAKKISRIFIDLIKTATGEDFELVKDKKDGKTHYILIHQDYCDRSFATVASYEPEKIVYVGETTESKLEEELGLSTVCLVDFSDNSEPFFLPENCPFENETYDLLKNFMEQYIACKYDIELKGGCLDIGEFYITYKEQLISDANEEELFKQYGRPVRYSHYYDGAIHYNRRKDRKYKSDKKRKINEQRLNNQIFEQKRLNKKMKELTKELQKGSEISSE